MYVSEHTGSRVHRQSFNHSVERIFLFFLPFFSLLFLTQPSFREARRTITVTRTPRFVISRLPIPLPNYLSTVQTDLFDTDRGHNRRPSAILGSARPRIIAPFHERYRVVVKSTRPVSITAHRSIPQLRFFNRFFAPTFPISSIEPWTSNEPIGANYSSPTPLSALITHHHHPRNLLPGKYPLNLAYVRWRLRWGS